jgi:hypothetical protein
VLVLHVILLPLNGWRLAQAFQERHRAHELSERGWKDRHWIRAAPITTPR